MAYMCIHIYILCGMNIYVPYVIHPSSVNGHLGYLHVLSIVNGATMNIGVLCIFSNCSFVQIWNCWVIWKHCFYFFEESPLFSILLEPIYIPTNRVRRFPFTITPSAFVNCRFQTVQSWPF